MKEVRRRINRNEATFRCVVEKMLFQTRARTLPFFMFYGDAGREAGRGGGREDPRIRRSSVSEVSRDFLAARCRCSQVRVRMSDGKDESRFPNQEMHGIKYSRESALHNSLPMSRNYSRGLCYARSSVYACARARAKHNLI